MTAAGPEGADDAGLDRLVSFARVMARRAVDNGSVADPLMAEVLEAIAGGHSRPRDLLLSSHYQQQFESGLAAASRHWLSLTDEERTVEAAAAAAVMDEELGPGR